MEEYLRIGYLSCCVKNTSQLWEEKWQKVSAPLPTTNFARKSYKLLKGKKHRTLLDLGCGDGKDSIYFAKKGFAVTAVDFSKSALEKLKDKAKIAGNLPIKTIQKDILNLNFKPNTFDVIYANLSLHYWNEKTSEKIFKKLHRILKPKGLLLFKCKSAEDILNGEEVERTKKRINFTKDFAKKVLEPFEVIKMRKTSAKHQRMNGKIVKSTFLQVIATKH